jgi:hypothetical protein
VASLPAPHDTMAARLPVAYEAAKVALANCASIDECQSWADKAEALASYARQADDETLRKQADRIQARAIRRCGELLKQIDGRGRPAENKEGALPNKSQAHAAREAGLSAHQQKQAVRVASVAAEVFEQSVESDAPPTVTRLADMGRRSAVRPVPNAPPPFPTSVKHAVDLKGRDPLDFNRAMHFEGMLRAYADDLRAWDINDILPRLVDGERASIRQLIAAIDGTHDIIITRI